MSKNKYNQPFFRGISTKADRRVKPVQSHIDNDYRYYDQLQPFPSAITFADEITIMSDDLYKYFVKNGFKHSGKVVVFPSKKS